MRCALSALRHIADAAATSTWTLAECHYMKYAIVHTTRDLFLYVTSRVIYARRMMSATISMRLFATLMLFSCFFFCHHTDLLHIVNRNARCCGFDVDVTLMLFQLYDAAR